MTASTVQRAAAEETSPSPPLFLDEESLPSLEEASCVLENRIMAARLILYLYALAWRLKAELEREGEGWAAENASHRPVYFDGEMIDEHLARADQAVQLVYLTDWRNSIMGVLPVNQPTIVNHYAYATFGNFREKTEQVSQRYGFTGREFGEIHGLMNFRARWMNPSWGRFTQEDPAGASEAFVYALNRPTVLEDPSGQEPDPEDVTAQGTTASTLSKKIVLLNWTPAYDPQPEWHSVVDRLYDAVKVRGWHVRYIPITGDRDYVRSEGYYSCKGIKLVISISTSGASYSEYRGPPAGVRVTFFGKSQWGHSDVYMGSIAAKAPQNLPLGESIANQQWNTVLHEIGHDIAISKGNEYDAGPPGTIDGDYGDSTAPSWRRHLFWSSNAIQYMLGDLDAGTRDPEGMNRQYYGWGKQEGE